jgi:hypothetical protein
MQRLFAPMLVALAGCLALESHDSAWPCRVDADCPSDRLCRSLSGQAPRCADPNECLADGDCAHNVGAEWTCHDKTCRAPQCIDASSCGGYSCVNFSCATSCDPSLGTKCAPGLACKRNVCERAAACSAVDDPACLPYRCDGSRCKTMCTTGSDCGGSNLCNAVGFCVCASSCAGYACNDATGSCRTSCKTDADCDVGYHCSSGVCGR